jgi:non-ribosomal peptide synthetase component F
MVPNREGQTLSDKPERAPWQARTMIEHNLEVANELILGTGNSDDIAIALHLMGWKIVQIDGDDRQWPMSEPHPLNPPWAENRWKLPLKDRR